MISIVPLLLIGFLTGGYGTLIGAGGGFVLLPVLLLLYPWESPEILTSISLAVVFFNALSGTEAYALMKRVDYKSGFLFSLAALPGAVLGAWTTAYIPRRLFDGIFGILMIGASGYLFAPKKLERMEGPPVLHGYRLSRRLVESDGTEHAYVFNPVTGIMVSFLVGYISSLLGIGGGIIHLPVLVFLLHFPVHIATATSHFILANMALTGTLTHILTGTFTHGVHRTIYLSLGVLFGAQLGAHLSNRIKGPWIMRSLALALGLVGIRILVQAWVD
jgi:uncharacterized membrane protein YfcA